jgi:hypothetical protein
VHQFVGDSLVQKRLKPVKKKLTIATQKVRLSIHKENTHQQMGEEIHQNIKFGVLRARLQKVKSIPAQVLCHQEVEEQVALRLGIVGDW